MAATLATAGVPSPSVRLTWPPTDTPSRSAAVSLTAIDSGPKPRREPEVTPRSRVRSSPAGVTPCTPYFSSPILTEPRSTSVTAATPGTFRTAEAVAAETRGPSV